MVSAAATWDARGIAFRVRVDTGGPLIPAAFNVTLRSHDDIGVEWFADFPVRAEGDEFTGLLPVDTSDPLLLEIQRLHGHDLNVLCGEHFDPVYLLVAPGEESAPADDALRRVEELERQRAERFEVPLGAGSEQYAAVAVVDGCLLRRPLRVPGLSLFPITQPRIGGDVYGILEAAAHSVGLPFPDARPAWMANVSHSHPVVGVLAPDLRADHPAAAADLFAEALSRSLALMALNRAATPRPLAYTVAVREEMGWRALALGSYEPPYTGNLLGGFISGESAHDLVAQWAALDADPRTAFWLGQANGIRGELRWDARVFRYVALLEAIAREIAPAPADPPSLPGERLLRWDGSPAEPGDARSRVYSLARRAADARQVNSQPQVGENLWTAVGLWIDVRNAVAHQGGWSRVAEIEATRDRTIRVRSALAAAGNGDPSQGVSALLMDIDTVTHDVLVVALRGGFE